MIILPRQARDKHRESSTQRRERTSASSLSFEFKEVPSLKCASGSCKYTVRDIHAHKVRKRCIFVRFYISLKCAINLPRQARDKHRETSKESGVFFLAGPGLVH